MDALYFIMCRWWLTCPSCTFDLSPQQLHLPRGSRGLVLRLVIWSALLTLTKQSLRALEFITPFINCGHKLSSKLITNEPNALMNQHTPQYRPAGHYKAILSVFICALQLHRSAASSAWTAARTASSLLTGNGRRTAISHRAGGWLEGLRQLRFITALCNLFALPAVHAYNTELARQRAISHTCLCSLSSPGR